MTKKTDARTKNLLLPPELKLKYDEAYKINKQIKELEKKLMQFKKDLLLHMGDSTHGCSENGVVLFTKMITTRSFFDEKKLAEDLPSVYGNYLTQKPITTFRFKGEDSEDV